MQTSRELPNVILPNLPATTVNTKHTKPYFSHFTPEMDLSEGDVAKKLIATISAIVVIFTKLFVSIFPQPASGNSGPATMRIHATLRLMPTLSRATLRAEPIHLRLDLRCRTAYLNDRLIWQFGKYPKRVQCFVIRECMNELASTAGYKVNSTPGHPDLRLSCPVRTVKGQVFTWLQTNIGIQAPPPFFASSNNKESINEYQLGLRNYPMSNGIRNSEPSQQHIRRVLDLFAFLLVSFRDYCIHSPRFETLHLTKYKHDHVGLAS